jgi:hypothetical protein
MSWKNNMKKFGGLMGFVLCIVTANGQDFRDRISAIRKDQQKLVDVHVVMEIAVYENEASAEAVYKQVADIRRHGDNYWYQFDENEMLMNEKYLVMVNNQAQHISCSKRSLTGEKELHRDFEFNLDSILDLQGEIRFVGIEDQAEHYLVKQKTGEIQDMHFFIDPESLSIKGIEYLYKAGHYVRIRFLLFDKQPAFDVGTFSEARYFRKEEEKMIPADLYKNYNLSSF